MWYQLGVRLLANTQRDPRAPDQDALQAPYEALIVGLREARDAGADEVLTRQVYALVRVIDFLNSNHLIAFENLCLPLVLLYNSLNDVLQGANAAEVFYSSTRRQADGLRSYHAFQGQLVAAVNVLVKSGMKPREARDWLRTQLAKKPIIHPPGHGRTSAKPVGVQQIMKWREQVSRGCASELTTKLATEVLQNALDVSDGTMQGATRQAEILLSSVHRMIP